MKKHCFLYFLLLLTVILPAGAQLGVGSWKVYPVFSGIENVVVASDKVYYTTSGQLYSYDSKNEETYNYTAGNRLNDNNIKNIYYDYDNDLLAVVYDNAKIDLIDSNDKVYCLPDIYDATLDLIPVINNVNFDGKKMYVATNFGIVVYDTYKKEVVTAGNYGINAISTQVCGENLWISDGYNYHYCKKDEKMTSSSVINWNMLNLAAAEDIMLDDKHIVIINNDRNSMRIVELNTQKEQSSIVDTIIYRDLRKLQKLSDGSVMCHTNDRIIIISPDRKVTVTSIANTPLETKKFFSAYETNSIASNKGLKQLWLGSEEGLSCYKLDDGELTVLSENYSIDNALTFTNVGKLYTAPATGNIYAFSYGFSMLKGNEVNVDGSYTNRFFINKISNGEITDITPVDYETYHSSNPSYNTNPVGFKSGFMVRESLSDPDVYLVGSFWNGLYAFKDRKEQAIYKDETSTMKTLVTGGRLQLVALDIDKHGNVWTAQLLTDGPEKQFHVLPADKVGKETIPSDWMAESTITESQHDGQLLCCQYSNNVFYKDALYGSALRVIKTNGTLTTDDDQVISSSEFIDQDGLTFNYERLQSMAEDKKGRVWVGTNNGIFEITRPDDITGTTFKINHLKVPRRDGTNYADYLLDGETIYDIAVDPANRKWLTTANSGVYLVSENGDEIIEHFDITNSPLTSNSVYAVTCGTDNEVYFGTTYGLLRYKSDASPAREDYSEVYAYPNPVRPEYTGWITVTGLMENSLVKIADAAGNVFFQGTSEGGMITWDGCDRQGHRVKTGVYYVFASHGSDEESTTGAVTKILVVN